MMSTERDQAEFWPMVRRYQELDAMTSETLCDTAFDLVLGDITDRVGILRPDGKPKKKATIRPWGPISIRNDSGWRGRV